MSHEDEEAAELEHAEEVGLLIFPARDEAAEVMQPSKQPFDFPTVAVAQQLPADSSAPFVAELKLASMKVSDRSIRPRSRKASASFCSTRISNPERCQDWKRR